ncbi:hypothetical protein EDE15_0102 [Edaphobacter aggregans]|jgi:hypothetical protein|uniref:Uncharacterized protein n=1 Tax=Edaphobacter aggregans TaxID=570835 RepID=A0A428MCU3_9BACT|nr:hypothetical protein EDE15_0102 [Edaphobacter aggregans]
MRIGGRILSLALESVDFDDSKLDIKLWSVRSKQERVIASTDRFDQGFNPFLVGLCDNYWSLGISRRGIGTGARPSRPATSKILTFVRSMKRTKLRNW